MDTKERILLVAYQMFINKGYYNTSMQSLVDASGLSKGAFYHHFKNKQEIYSQVIEQYFLSFYRKVNWTRYASKNMSIKDIEQEIQQFYLSFLPHILPITNDGMSRYFVLYFEAYNLLPNFKKEIQSFYKNLEEILIQASDNMGSRTKALEIIAKYEGYLFLLAVNPNLNLKEILERHK